MALHNLGIPWHRYIRTRRDHKGFARAIQRAEEFRDEQLSALHYSEAISGNLDCQRFLMNRSDRAREFRQNIKMRDKEIKAKVNTPDEPLDVRLARAEQRARERKAERGEQ